MAKYIKYISGLTLEISIVHVSIGPLVIQLRLFSLTRSTLQIFFLFVFCFLLFEPAQAHFVTISSTEINKTRITENIPFEVTFTITNMFNDAIPEDKMKTFYQKSYSRGEGASWYLIHGQHHRWVNSVFQWDRGLPALAPGGTLHLKTRLNSSLGTWYFKGCISIRDDNDTEGLPNYHAHCGASSSNPIEIVRDLSDLSVELVTQPSTVMAGLPFALVAKVRNAGPWYSKGTTEVHYYYSETDSNQNRDYAHLLNIVDDGTFGPGSERHVYYRGPTGLEVGQTRYFFACAGLSPWQNDSNTNNNCSEPILVTSQAPYKLQFSEVSAPNEHPYGPSEPFPLTVRIENTGEAQSPPFVLDVNIGGGVEIDGIPPGGQISHVFELRTPAGEPPQTEQSYTACMRIYASETDGRQRDHCADPVTIRIDPNLDRGYDLAFASVDWQPHSLALVLNNESSRFLNNNYLLTFRLANLGQTRSEVSTLTVWRSTDASTTSKGDDQQFASSPVPAFDPGIHPIQQFRPPEDNSADSFYYACLSDTPTELNSDNNCSSPIRSNRGLLSPEKQERVSLMLNRMLTDPKRLDVHVSGALMPDDSISAVVEVGEYFNIQAEINNTSQIPYSNVVTHFYRSADSTIDPYTLPKTVTSLSVNINPGDMKKRHYALQETTVGNYLYGACVQVESTTDNSLLKCGNSVLVSVVEPVQELRSAPLTMGADPKEYSLRLGKHLEKIPSQRFGRLVKEKTKGPKGARRLKQSPIELKSILTFRLSGLKARGYQPGVKESVKVQLKNSGSQAVDRQLIELQISSKKLFKQKQKIGKKMSRGIKAKRSAINTFNIAVPEKPGRYFLRACIASGKLCSDPVALTVKASKSHGSQQYAKKGKPSNTAKKKKKIIIPKEPHKKKKLVPLVPKGAPRISINKSAFTAPASVKLTVKSDSKFKVRYVLEQKIGSRYKKAQTLRRPKFNVTTPGNYRIKAHYDGGQSESFAYFEVKSKMEKKIKKQPLKKIKPKVPIVPKRRGIKIK